MENSTHPKTLGRYEIVRELGKGAMGVVYEGKDPSIGRRVAIKTARRDVMERTGMADEMMKRFLREASAAGVLNHPNIITIYDVGEENGVAYMAMEFIEGKDLSSLIATQRVFDAEKTVEWGAQICDALACAHDQGIYHRDIKPANIMIPYQGTLKVADFGIARTQDSTLTQDGALIGTPSYMSPEQFMGQKVDGRSDLFCLGIILYEMLTGEKPFTGEALTTIMHHILKSEPTPPHELNFTVSDALSAVVTKAMSKKPQDRYPDGRSMARALRESLKSNPDMSVIQCTGAGMEATVMSDAQAPAPAGQPGGSAASTVTMVSPGPPADAPTLPGASDTSGQPESLLGATQPSTPRPPENMPAKSGSDRSIQSYARMAAAVAAAVCILLGIVWYRIGGAGDAPSAAAPVAETVQTSVRVNVYVTADLELYDSFDQPLSDADSRQVEALVPGGKVSFARGMFVQTRDPATGDAFGEPRPLDEFGATTVTAPETAQTVRFEVIEAGKVQHYVDTSEWKRAQTFLIFR